jgi:hypothetical protein
LQKYIYTSLSKCIICFSGITKYRHFHPSAREHHPIYVDEQLKKAASSSLRKHYLLNCKTM